MKVASVMTPQSASLLEVQTHATQPVNQAQPGVAPGVPSGNTTGLQVQFSSTRSSVELLDEWAELEHRLDSRALACSAAWTKAWLEAYGDLIAHRFVEARSDGRLVGICLITEGVGQFDGPFRLKTLHVGTAGEPEADSACVEYNQLLVDPRFRRDFVAGLCDLVDGLSGWEELRLDGFSAEDIEPLLEVRNDWQTRHVECNYFDLELARDAKTDAIAQFGYATRKNLRKNLKALGAVHTEWAETPEQARSIFADLVRLHQKRWIDAGQPGSYASERFTKFNEQLIDRLQASGQMGLFRVVAEEYGGQSNVTLGCVQLFVDRGRILCYQGGSAPYTNKLSPGVMVDYLCIEECLARGFLAYDFLGGTSHHKRKMGTAATELVWAVRTRPSWKRTAARCLRQIKHSSQRFRQNILEISTKIAARLRPQKESTGSTESV